MTSGCSFHIVGMLVVVVVPGRHNKPSLGNLPPCHHTTTPLPYFGNTISYSKRWLPDLEILKILNLLIRGGDKYLAGLNRRVLG